MKHICIMHIDGRYANKFGTNMSDACRNTFKGCFPFKIYHHLWENLRLVNFSVANPVLHQYKDQLPTT